MAGFVKVTSTDGQTVYIHPNNVTAIVQRQDGLIDILLVGGGVVVVADRPEVIIGALEKAMN
jgi:hypothetical protein